MCLIVEWPTKLRRRKRMMHSMLWLPRPASKALKANQVAQKASLTSISSSGVMASKSAMMVLSVT